MMEPTALHVIDPHAKARQCVIDCLREHLARAERDELRSVHIVAFRSTDGDILHESAGFYSVAEVVGALEIRKLGVIQDSGKR